MTVIEEHAKQNREHSILTRTLDLLFGNKPHKAKTPFEVHEMIEQGFPMEVVISLSHTINLLDDTQALIKVVGMSHRTFQRRKNKPQPLTAEQSSRTWRFAEVLSKAEDVFGDMEEAERWMNTPAMGLEGHKPIDLISTQVGYELVDDFLTRMDYGVYT
ncbi:type II RES/Xre toxin-antitoxin system antitoxin [Halomonas sp. LBP4]|uniref:type II RES/Xre toxin-antitoxin system antitoxin n=1 Tax=Halomonas sp. LBP4 TaxID=2044917 RepID=UPI000D757A7D|nr:antitoxin Xre/MbcA/ParS toxin-binding domain-containing protein [Halomonas sp. LBP4]PXX95982.1 toxin-antitoxin system antitoxin component [Halomonas sp. LBP4]